jgi:hypothetical protein
MPDQLDRRWKILHVNPSEILTILQGWRASGFVYKVTSTAIPEDAVVLDCQADWQRRAIGLRLWSSSFPEVPDGCPCEAMERPDDLSFKAYAVRTESSMKGHPVITALSKLAERVRRVVMAGNIKIDDRVAVAAELAGEIELACADLELPVIVVEDGK